MTTSFHTPIPFRNPVTSAAVNAPLSGIDAGLVNILAGAEPFVQLNLGTPVDLTIASDTITIVQTRHRVDTQSGAASDDLSTINGGAEGDMLVLSIVNDARTVTIKHGVGNVFLAGGTDAVLNDSDQVLVLYYVNAKWMDSRGLGVSSSLGGAITTLTPRTELGGDAASISIANILSSYNLLVVELELRTDRAATDDDVLVQVNADVTAANYHSSAAIMTTAYAYSEQLGTAANWRLYNAAAGNTAPSDTFSFVRLYLPGYSQTDRQKTMSWEGFDLRNTTSGNLVALAGGGRWANPGARISRLVLTPGAGANFKSGSAFAVYGLL